MSIRRRKSPGWRELIKGSKITRRSEEPVPKRKPASKAAKAKKTSDVLIGYTVNPETKKKSN